MPRLQASARRTQLVATYGVGALFPSAAESFLVCGIDEWDVRRCPAVPEQRLAAALGVQTFRQPPASGQGSGVPVVRFPEWYYCPRCRVLDEHWRIADKREGRCRECNVDLVPSRFVACCPAGHIQDFPYFRWLHRGQQPQDRTHRMSIRSRGQSSSLADIELSCTCKVEPRVLAGAMQQGALLGVTTCSGEKRWLPESDPDDCPETPRALQRGSSNVWFPVVRSAISIPSWMDTMPAGIQDHWDMIKNADESQLPLVLTLAAPALSVEERERLTHAILAQRNGDIDDEAHADAQLRRQEYDALCIGRSEADPGQNFVATAVPVGEAIASAVAQVMAVPRLREVRALQAFTRVTPSSGPEDRTRFAQVSESSRPRWLPAIEVLGEGIFLRLEETVLAAWERSSFAVERTERIQRSLDVRALEYQSVARRLLPRELVLHTLAHVLLEELSLDAGYPASSLRERVYSDDDAAGVLVYTASADAAGSLGGLVAQSGTDRLAAVLVSALERSGWCTQDPVCIESAASGSWGLNLAACHACVLLPEVSCETQNTLLDRAVLVGTPDRPDEGFFSGLVGRR